MAKSLKEVLRPVHRGVTVGRQSLLGTTIPPVSFWYSSMRSMMMPMFVPSDVRHARDTRAETLHRDGYVSLPGLYDPRIINTIRQKFDRIAHDESALQRHRFSFTIKDTAIFDQIPEVFELLRSPQLQQVLHSFYKSYFQLHFLSATRLFPIPEGQATKEDLLSANWHCDNHSPDLVHFVVFLHDVTEAHGPTRVMSKQRTAQLMRKGFYTRFDYRIPPEEMENREYVKQLTGACGDAHLMISPLALHRAGIPAAGLSRDSLFFSFRPALEPAQFQKLSDTQKNMYRFLHWMSEDKLNPGSKTFMDKDIVYKKN